MKGVASTGTSASSAARCERIDRLDVRDVIARRAAQELAALNDSTGYYVNLGIGMPTLVANYVPAGIPVHGSPFAAAMRSGASSGLVAIVS